MKFIHILQLIWWIATVILLFWNPFFGLFIATLHRASMIGSPML